MNALKWIKTGLVFCPDGKNPWAARNASFPSALVLKDRFRIFYTSLDKDNVGRVGTIDLDLQSPQKILGQSADPILDIGAAGTFDDSGINVFSVVAVDDQVRLYYQGWQRTHKAPYCIFSGVAVSTSGGNFKKHSRAPILDRIDQEPLLRGAPFVLKDSSTFKMWYCSCSEWVSMNGKMDYRISISYLESRDGLDWSGKPVPALHTLKKDDYAVGRPSVVKIKDVYHMWFSIRSFSEPYRLGYATSKDGINWTRNDENVGIGRSESGWDSEMICYPYVVQVGSRLHMFYNGNQHGVSGFGHAYCEV